MQATIETESPELEIKEINNKVPKDFWEYVRKIDLIKLSIAFTVLFLIVAITMSLIINPKSLNSENNLSVGLLLGALINSFSIIVQSYFAPKK